MPVIGLLLGGVNITGQSFTIGHAVVKWGLFLQNVIDFTIIAFCIFIAVTLINKLVRKEEAAPAPPSEEVLLLKEIRDLLKNNKEIK
jgi:large conductance mechanosensitive channel